MPERLLTDCEVAEILALYEDGHRAPREAVRYLVRTGRLKACKIGRRLRFKREWVEEFIERNTTEVI